MADIAYKLELDTTEAMKKIADLNDLVAAIEKRIDALGERIEKSAEAVRNNTSS